MKVIELTEIENIKIGHADNQAAATGCTVIICEQGAPTGIDIRGGGPASRETQLLNPLAACDKIHAVLLSGGSAFGLDAAGGVMSYLEDRGIGFDVGVTKVPLVSTSCLFDLQVGDTQARPDVEMGYAACLAAELNEPREGNVGAGTGATVGKYKGVSGMMKSGIGMYAVELGDLKVGALVAVNALGDVKDEVSGAILAGLLNEEQTAFLNTEEMLYKEATQQKNLFTGNTTLGVIITNGTFNKVQMTKIAAMAQNGLAKTICPVHTTADGDSVYALSVGEVAADINVVGTLAAKVMAKAINRAVLMAEPAYGLKAATDFMINSK
ncbi:P1 family peptidase [Cellulosilyticum sp. WCF-2]|uniref:P1 family peptidase n=1 Tax=Cellulosilyticum sp. WCF-2 TaxID=2497860 RepID=UPI000F8C96B1|nr:P1 family peptidase [Cellulosilyticum sp. WCF-2]QEH69662.1 P1 family peptidase [Cellulosilyticum sp. WCF-2]